MDCEEEDVRIIVSTKQTRKH